MIHLPLSRLLKNTGAGICNTDPEERPVSEMAETS